MLLILILFIIGEVNSSIDFKYEKCDPAFCNNKGECHRHEKDGNVIINCK